MLNSALSYLLPKYVFKKPSPVRNLKSFLSNSVHMSLALLGLFEGTSDNYKITILSFRIVYHRGDLLNQFDSSRLMDVSKVHSEPEVVRYMDSSG